MFHYNFSDYCLLDLKLSINVKKILKTVLDTLEVWKKCKINFNFKDGKKKKTRQLKFFDLIAGDRMILLIGDFF